MISKRQLGVILLAGGLTSIATLLAIDWIGAGEFAGIGPVQRLALAAGSFVTVLGASLIPFGDRPA